MAAGVEGLSTFPDIFLPRTKACFTHTARNPSVYFGNECIDPRRPRLHRAFIPKAQDMRHLCVGMLTHGADSRTFPMVH